MGPRTEAPSKSPAAENRPALRTDSPPVILLTISPLGEACVEKPSEPSDVELVAAVRRGNWSAFDTLYFRHKEWTYRLAWRFAADENEAQDVVQEVFIYLAGKLREPAFTLRASLTTLLYPATKHTALALKRKRRRMNPFSNASENDSDIPIPAKPEIPDPDTARAEIAHLLRTLSEAHREITLMRFVDDMTLEEIAEALSIPLGTAKSRLHHALAALREDPRFRRFANPG